MISDQDIEAIREANERGVSICLASGRMYEEIKVVMNTLGVPSYAVCQNGATIIGLDGEVIQSNSFERELALSVTEATYHSELVKVICSAEGNFDNEMKADVQQIGKRFMTPLRDIRIFEDAIREGFTVTKFSIYGNVPLLEQMLGLLKRLFDGRVTASFSDPDGIDVMPGGVDKRAGIETLMDLTGIQRQEVACIGDSFNDLSMFRIIPYSFAMSHAKEAVKKEANTTVISVSSALRELFDRPQ